MKLTVQERRSLVAVAAAVVLFAVALYVVLRAIGI